MNRFAFIVVVVALNNSPTYEKPAISTITQQNQPLAGISIGCTPQVEIVDCFPMCSVQAIQSTYLFPPTTAYDHGKIGLKYPADEDGYTAMNDVRYFVSIKIRPPKWQYLYKDPTYCAGAFIANNVVSI